MVTGLVMVTVVGNAVNSTDLSEIFGEPGDDRLMSQVTG